MTNKRFIPFRSSLHLPLVLLGLAAALMPTAMAQVPEESSPDRFEASPTSLDQVVTATDLIEYMKRGDPRGSRGSFNACLVSPGQLGNTDMLWSDRPLFVWRGQADRIVLESFDSGEVLWNEEVSALTPEDFIYQIPYTGTPLTPGELYSWRVLRGQDSSDEVLFEVIGGENRDRISQAMQQPPLMGNTVEQAKYFVAEGLWSDAFILLQPEIQESADLNASTTDFIRHLCQVE
mgnify:CR=1 FL=1